MLDATRATLEQLQPFRDQYRAAMNAQIVHDSWHRRGLTTQWRLSEGQDTLGYLALGGRPGEPKDTVKEFYLVPEARHRAEELFATAIRVVQPRWVEAQTNDPFLWPLLPRFAPRHQPLVHLFADGGPTTLSAPGVGLRRIDPAEHSTVFFAFHRADRRVGARSGGPDRRDRRAPLPLQPTLWRPLHGSRPGPARPWTGELPGPGTQADRPGGRSHPGGPVRSLKRGIPARTGARRHASLWADRPWGDCSLTTA